MRTIIIETPPLDTLNMHDPPVDYAEYSRQCFASSCALGECPLSAAVVFKSFFDVTHWTRLPEVMALTCAWLQRADELALYVDHGVYWPMWTTAYLAQQADIPVSLRVLKTSTRCGRPGMVSLKKHPRIELRCELPDKHPGPHGATYSGGEGSSCVRFWGNPDNG